MSTTNRQALSTTHLLVMAVVAVVGALLAAYVWNSVSNVATPLFAFLGPIGWIGVSGFYMITPVLIGLLIQRPGVATVYGLVQGVLEMLFGNFFGAMSIVYAGLEGLGVDIGLVPFRWRASLPAALLAGALGNFIVVEVYVYFIYALTTAR